ncbi:hypothetical protein RZS08_28225, partial [Arthrospira platensis SPKY1]|nr:hypothetical protein [Arthrospira platensis SPKY1]
MGLFIAHQPLLGQDDLFDGIGKKGGYNKEIKGKTTYMIPQLQVAFESYVETVEVVSESRKSRWANNAAAFSKGKSYVGQKGSAKTTTILDAG